MAQDLRAQRCGDLLAPVTDLAVAALGCQSGDAGAFTDVARAARSVRDVADQGAAGVGNRDYEDWCAGASEVLSTMIDRAESRDAQGVWAAFAHPQYGMHRLGAACSGLPGWAGPA